MAMIRPFEGSLFAEDFLREAIIEFQGWQDVTDAELTGLEAALRDLFDGFAEEWKRYEHGLAVVESKRWLRPPADGPKRSHPLGGPPHRNPDGEEIGTPHIHVYREGYGDKWALPLPADFRSVADLGTTLDDFLRYCNVTRPPRIQKGLFI